MDTQQLLDSLTAHIALYHHSLSSSSRSLSASSDRNPNPRKSILQWFSGLSTHQRQSYLTILDPDFIGIVTQMQSRLLTRGHGFFFLLPDLPSSSHPSLPTICFRRSRGLLARHSTSNELEKSISSAVCMFGSMEGTERRQCAALDVLTVSEDFVNDMGRFVETMDAVSDGGFLTGDAVRMGSPWYELPWLKDKGYYSLEAFVANKLECQLRMSWMNATATKKQRAIKSKDKLGAVDIAASAFWRKKCDLDWFLGLDPGIRRKIYAAFLGKGAKSLVRVIAKTLGDLKDDVLFHKTDAGVLPNLTPSMVNLKQNRSQHWSDLEFSLYAMSSSFCRKKSMFSDCMIQLVVLQQINFILLTTLNYGLEAENLFFSKLNSVQTVCDYVLRNLRGFVITVSREYVEFELLGNKAIHNITPQNGKKAPADSTRCKKKKCRSSKLNDITQPKNNAALPESCLEESANTLVQCDNTFTVMQRKIPPIACSIRETPVSNKNSSAANVEHKTSLVGAKEGIPARRGRRKGSKARGSNLNERDKLQSSEVTSERKILPKPNLRNEEAEKKEINHIAVPLANDILLQDKIQSQPISLHVDHPSSESNAKVVKGLVYSTSTVYNRNHDIVKSENGSHTTIEIVPTGSGKDDSETVPLTPTRDTCEMTNKCSFSSTASNRSHAMNAVNSEHVGPRGGCTEEQCLSSRNASSPNSDSDKPRQSTSTKNTSRKHLNINGSSSEREYNDSFPYKPTIYVERTSYEWPNLSPIHFSHFNSNHIPAATDRYHLDVAENWSSHLHQSFFPARQKQVRSAPIESACGRILPPHSPMSFDWPPMVRSCTRLSQSGTASASYDSVYNSRLQSSLCTGITDPAMQFNGACSDSEWTYSGDFFDTADFKNVSDFGDDNDSHWLSEEESDVQAANGRDYNKFFGGGVMYWNTSDHVNTSFSRAPSHSSEDSSWAWHEADLKRAIDDMVDVPGLPSYNTNGVASPPANALHSPFDTLGHGQQSHGYVISSNDLNVKVLESPCSATDVPDENTFGSKTTPAGVIEALKGEPISYPILRPIIIPNLSTNGSRSEFKLKRDRVSPCVSSTRRDPQRIKRPPSPVVLCVPRAPRVPTPSPVGESRKQRGFPIVRSGSSSPRHWGMRNWYLEENNIDSKHLPLDGPEVVWPAWGNKALPGGSLMPPIPGPLLQDRLIALSQLSRDQEHPDVAFPLQPPDIVNCPSRRPSLCVMQSLLQEEISSFCQKVAADNQYRKPYINWAVKRVARSLQVLWPRSRTNIYGSNVTGLALPTSDVDLVVCLPPVRNLEPIKEAGILEGRNGIKETCLQHAARYLANQDWVKNDSLKTIENTAIPLIMLVAEVPMNMMSSDLSTGDTESIVNCADVISIRLDISFKSSSHTGLRTTELVRELTEQFPACIPLALVLKQFLADRSLDHSYSGGLSSYCLVLLITRFLQHEHHIGRPLNQNLGSLLLDFLYFFGNVFDPRQMRVSIQGSGLYLTRERGHSIDPIHIDDPLCSTNNVGRNCFRIHQCIKAFADAYSVFESELSKFSCNYDPSSYASMKLLPKIIPSIDPKNAIS